MGQTRSFGDVRVMSAQAPIANIERTSRHFAFGPLGDIHFAAKNASTHRESGGAKGIHIGLDLCRVAANELGLKPPADREIRTCHH